MNLSKPARKIYDLAYDLANQRHDQAVDGLHLVLATMQHPQLAGRAGEVLGELEAKRKMLWEMFLQYELDAHRPDAALSGSKSARLLSYERVWTNSAQQWGQITSAQIIDTLLRNEQTLVQMVRYCGIEYVPLLRALSQRAVLGEDAVADIPLLRDGSSRQYNTPLPYGPSDIPLPPSIGPETGPRMPIQPAPHTEPLYNPYAGSGLLQRIGRPVTATPNGLYAHIHPPVSTRLIDSLSDGHRGRELTVFAGHCGTAVQAIPHVIADRLAYVDRSNPQGTISGLAGVWVIHAGDLFDNTQRDTPSTEDIQGLFHEARERRLILVVDEAELLAQDFGDSERRDQILRELGRPSDVPAVAIYHLGEDETYEAGQVSLGLYNAVPVPLLPDPEKRTHTLLKASFAPYWQQQGYTIHDPERAFELIFKLAPGLKAVHYRSGKSWEERKLLPYAVIDVGIEAIEMLAKNQDILYVAQAALSALEPIRAREREIEKSEMRDALKRAEEDICRLISKTKPEFRAQTPMELTRAHLMAQLFYPSGTQFHPFPLASNETATVPRTASVVEQRLSK